MCKYIYIYIYIVPENYHNFDVAHKMETNFQFPNLHLRQQYKNDSKEE